MTPAAGPEDRPPDDRRRRLVTLVALTFAAGAVDAVSLAALTGVFAANQTGNLILVPVGIAGSAFTADVPAALVAAGAFLAAAALGHRALPRRGEGPWGPPAGRVVAMQLALVLSVLVVTWVAPPDARPGRIALGGMLAAAMGLQAALANRLAVPGLPTVMLTGALIGLAQGPVRAAPGRLAHQAAALSVMGGGALASAFMLKASLPGAVALAAAPIALALVVAAGARHPV